VAVQNYGAGDLLEVQLEGQRATELIPFTDAFVPVVDVVAGRVVVVVPVYDADKEADNDTDPETEPR
jgi:16S rRNA processing protein RimM